MSNIRVNRNRVFIVSIAVIAVQIVIFSILWANPVVSGLMAEFANHPSVKTYEFIGGESTWKLMRMLFHVAFMGLSIWVYLRLYPALPGGLWLKGASFGALIGFFRFVPEAFNLWTMVAYPEPLILLRLILGVVGFLVFGVLVSVIFEKSGAIVVER